MAPWVADPWQDALALFFCPCFILFPSLLFPGALLLSYVEDLTFALGSAFWGSQANLTSTWETPVDAGRLQSGKGNMVFLQCVEPLEILTRLKCSWGKAQWLEIVVGKYFPTPPVLGHLMYFLPLFPLPRHWSFFFFFNLLMIWVITRSWGNKGSSWEESKVCVAKYHDHRDGVSFFL